MLLRVRDTESPYEVRSGQFHVGNGKLDIALELGIGDHDEEDLPPDILVRFANLPFTSAPTKLTVNDRHDHWDADDGAPHAYVYSGFHHAAVSGWIDVLTHDEGRLTVDVTIVTDDVNRYDEAARPSTLTGRVVLSAHPRDEMWSV